VHPQLAMQDPFSMKLDIATCALLGLKAVSMMNAWCVPSATMVRRKALLHALLVPSANTAIRMNRQPARLVSLANFHHPPALQNVPTVTSAVMVRQKV